MTSEIPYVPSPLAKYADKHRCSARCEEIYETFDSCELDTLHRLAIKGIDHRDLSAEYFDRASKLIKAGLLESERGVLAFTPAGNVHYILWAANRGSCRQEELDLRCPK